MYGNKGPDNINADFMSEFSIYREVTETDDDPPDEITEIIDAFTGGDPLTTVQMGDKSVSATRNKIAIFPVMTNEGDGGVKVTFWQELILEGVPQWISVLTSTGFLATNTLTRFGGFWYGRYKISVEIEDDGEFEIWVSTSVNAGALD